MHRQYKCDKKKTKFTVLISMIVPLGNKLSLIRLPIGKYP